MFEQRVDPRECLPRWPTLDSPDVFSSFLPDHYWQNPAVGGLLPYFYILNKIVHLFNFQGKVETPKMTSQQLYVFDQENYRPFNLGSETTIPVFKTEIYVKFC